MRCCGGRLTGAAAVGALLAASVPAQAQSERADPPLPEAPGRLPMEAVWDRVPGTQGKRFDVAGPILQSRWGNIVIRAKRDGNEVVTALNTLRCGRRNVDATYITMLGRPVAGLCRGVVALPRGETRSISGDGYSLHGTADGWTIVEFAQRIPDVMTYASGLAPAPADSVRIWGVTRFGAVYYAANGKFVFPAPGETVDLGSNETFVVTPVMDEGELRLHVVAAGMARLADLDQQLFPPTARRPPTWFRLLFFGTPLVVLFAIGYGLRRWWRGRSSR
jgi:hypothetical protein